MAKRRSKSTKKALHWSVWAGFALAVIGILFSIYAFNTSASKKDVLKIVSAFQEGTNRQDRSLPALIPEGRKKFDPAEIEKLEIDIKRVESSPFFGLSGTTYLDIARFFFAQAMFDKAIEYVNKSIQKMPRNAKGLLLRSVLRFYRGAFQAALSDTALVIGKGYDDNDEAAALTIKGLVTLLIGNPESAKDSLLRAASYFDNQGKKEILVFCYYLAADACFILAEYDIGDDYYFRALNAAEQLGSSDTAEVLTIIILALMNPELDFKSLLDNYDRLLKTSDEGFFRDFILIFYKMAISISDDEAFIIHVEAAVRFCQKHGITYLEQVLREVLFEASIDLKNSFRKDLWQNIMDSPVKLPTIEADTCLASGKYFQGRKDPEKAMAFFKVALERYKECSNKKNIVEAEINLYLSEFNLKNYYNAYKMLCSARDNINGILGKNTRTSYKSKRASEDIIYLELHRKNIEELLPIIEKFLN